MVVTDNGKDIGSPLSRDSRGVGSLPGRARWAAHDVPRATPWPAVAGSRPAALKTLNPVRVSTPRPPTVGGRGVSACATGCYLKLRWTQAARVDLRAGAGDLLDDADDLVGVAELIVVPDVDHGLTGAMVAGRDVPAWVVPTSRWNDLGGCGDLLAQVGWETLRRKLFTSSRSTSCPG